MLFLLPYVFQLILLNPELVGGITGGITNYPYFYTPKFLREALQYLQMLKSERSNH